MGTVLGENLHYTMNDVNLIEGHQSPYPSLGCVTGIERLCFGGGWWDKNVSSHAHIHFILA